MPAFPFWMIDEQQFRGWPCFLQIAITERPAAIIDYCVSPWEKATLNIISLCIAFPTASFAGPWLLLTGRMGTRASPKPCRNFREASRKK